jgi:hypothetical protein
MQFRRALAGNNFDAAWMLALELPPLPLVDGSVTGASAGGVRGARADRRGERAAGLARGERAESSGLAQARRRTLRQGYESR